MDNGANENEKGRIVAGGKKDCPTRKIKKRGLGDGSSLERGERGERERKTCESDGLSESGNYARLLKIKKKKGKRRTFSFDHWSIT